MFVNSVYQNRRLILKHKVDSGIIWLQGNREIGMNYRGNSFPFRQDSSFLYYTGIDIPGLHLIIDIDNDREILVGDDLTIDATIWVGNLPALATRADESGITEVLSTEEFENLLEGAVKTNRDIHTLPLYHQYQESMAARLLGKPSNFSVSLIEAIVGQRSKKEDREVREIEDALSITAEVHKNVMLLCNEGTTEREMYARAMEIIYSHGGRLAYPAILTNRGETLHINTYNNTLKKGQMLLCDIGAENSMHYASDITRTTPVGRKFDTRQKDIYSIVLEAQKKSIDALKPGKAFKDIHLIASEILASGLVDLGLMKGAPEEIVEKGAHALFFPHGLGHMIGMDVHDMEGLGEKYVGYNKYIQRSEQFGINHLRLGRTLEKDNVITVEPGLYFIPQLIALWKREKRFSEYVNYDLLDNWLDFGGVRIEDDILITSSDYEVLGPPIPKEIEDLESL